MGRINPGIVQPHPKTTQTQQNLDLERLLRQRPTSEPLNRGISDAPRNLFEMDNVDAQSADDGQHLAYNYRTGLHVLQARQIPFQMKGVLVADSTGHMDLEYSGVVQKLRFRVKTAPSGSSVVGHLELNGTSIITVTLAAGAFAAETALTTRTRVLCAVDAGLLSLPTDVLEVFVDTVDGTSADLVGYVVV